jgi:hypothetical protein
MLIADPFSVQPALPEVGYTPTPRRQPPNPIAISPSYAQSRELPYEMASATTWNDSLPRCPASLASSAAYLRPMPMSAGPRRTHYAESPLRHAPDSSRSTVESYYESDDQSYYSASRRGRRASLTVDRRNLHVPSPGQTARRHHHPARRNSLEADTDHLADDLDRLSIPSSRHERGRGDERAFQDETYRRRSHTRRPASRSSREDVKDRSRPPQMGSVYASDDERPRHSRHAIVQGQHPQRHRRVSSLSSNEYWSSDDEKLASRPKLHRRATDESQVHRPNYHRRPSYGPSDGGGYHPPPPRQHSGHRRHHSLSHKRDQAYRDRETASYAPSELRASPHTHATNRRPRASSLLSPENPYDLNDYDDTASVAGTAPTFEDGPISAGGRASDYGLPLHPRNVGSTRPQH